MKICYVLDDNAIPSVYVLQPASVVVEALSQAGRGEKGWWDTENKVREYFVEASKSLAEDARLKYIVSNTFENRSN